MTRHPHDLLIPNSSEQSVLVSVIQDEALVGFDQFIIPKACLKKFETLDLLYVRLLDQKGNNLAQAAIDLNPMPYLVNFNSLIAPADLCCPAKRNYATSYAAAIFCMDPTQKLSRKTKKFATTIAS